ncbi:FecR family protein [Sphingomonas koreensis]
MSEGTEERAHESARAQAATWLARMRGPEAERWAPDLALWRAQAPENEAAYQSVLRKWERTAFLANTPLGKGRDLDRAALWYRRPAARYAAVAAMLFVVAAGALSFGRFGFGSFTPAPVQYASTDRGIRAVRLADGTRLTLDAGARVEVDEARRRARLFEGRARFDVTAAAGGRFVVDYPGGSVAADDAQFDVGLRDGLVRVVAWRGAFDVARDREGGTGNPTRVTSGQMLVFRPAAGPGAPQPAHAGELAWTRGMLSFDGTRLADAVEAINGYNRQRIVLAAPAIGELRVTGAFRATDPHGFARAVANMFELSVETASDGAIVLKPERKA